MWDILSFFDSLNYYESDEQHWSDVTKFLETYIEAQTYDPDLHIDTLWDEMLHHSPYFHLERLVFLSAIGVNDEITMGIRRVLYDIGWLSKHCSVSN